MAFMPNINATKTAYHIKQKRHTLSWNTHQYQKSEFDYAPIPLSSLNCWTFIVKLRLSQAMSTTLNKNIFISLILTLSRISPDNRQPITTTILHFDNHIVILIFSLFFHCQNQVTCKAKGFHTIS